MKLLLLEDQAADRDVLLAFLEKYAHQTGYDLTALLCAAPEEIPAGNAAFDAALLDIMKGARRAPQLTNMLLAVLPETKCQGLFNQVHKIFTYSTRRAGVLFPGLSLRRVPGGRTF